jgi:universal stress protein A
MATISRILVATDFSADAARALDYAVELAHRFGAEVIVLHVHEVVDLVPGAAAADQLRAAAQEELERSAAALRGRDVRVRSLLRAGAPSTEILRAAETEGADLLVVGTHGHTGLARLLLGSVAERIVRGAVAPVLTVRHPSRTDPAGSR